MASGVLADETEWDEIPTDPALDPDQSTPGTPTFASHDEDGNNQDGAQYAHGVQVVREFQALLSTDGSLAEVKVNAWPASESHGPSWTIVTRRLYRGMEPGDTTWRIHPDNGYLPVFSGFEPIAATPSTNPYRDLSHNLRYWWIPSGRSAPDTDQ